jgi:hypothetical protein
MAAQIGFDMWIGAYLRPPVPSLVSICRVDTRDNVGIVDIALLDIVVDDQLVSITIEDVDLDDPQSVIDKISEQLPAWLLPDTTFGIIDSPT